MLERLVCERINIHLRKIGKLPLVQSANHRNYSTETALSKVVSDIIMADDAGDVTVLALLDLSAAFNAVVHVILLKRLQTTHHVTGNALQWFRSYFHGRYLYCLQVEHQLQYRLVMMFLEILYLDLYCSFFTHLTFFVLLQRMDRFDPITDFMKRKFHWLPVIKRVQFKICIMVFKAVHNHSPSYISELNISSTT